MAYERFALVLDDEKGSLGELAVRLLRMGLDSLYINQQDEGSLLAEQESRRIGALLLPSITHPEAVREALDRVAGRAGLNPTAVILIGAKPDDASCHVLRKIGIRWWIEPGDDPVTLRSLVSFVMSAEDDLDSRIEPRIPALLLAEVHDGAQPFDATVRNLSVGGAFLECDARPERDQEVQVALGIEEERVSTRARVAFCVDPDGRLPEGMPLGFGVQFVDLDLASQAILRRFLAEQLGRHQL